MLLVRLLLKIRRVFGVVAWLALNNWLALGFSLLCAVVLFVVLCNEAMPDPETEERLRDLSRDNHRACPYKLEPRGRRERQRDKP